MRVVGIRGGLVGLFGVINPRIRRIVGVIVMVIALFMVVGAVVATVHDVNLRHNGVATNATVTDTRVDMTRSGSRTGKNSGGSSLTAHREYEVEFTVGGKQYDEWAGDGASLTVGSAVRVVYDPANPPDVQFESNLSGAWWVGPLVLVLIGGVFGWLGLFMIRLNRVRAGTGDGPRLDSAESSVNMFK